MLSVIIVFKALASTGNGILAGLGKFSLIAKSNVVSGALMFALCVPLTYFAGLYGALFSLAVSQLVNAAVNYWYICGESRRLPIYCYCEDSVGSLLRFSFAVIRMPIFFFSIPPHSFNVRHCVNDRRVKVCGGQSQLRPNPAVAHFAHDIIRRSQPAETFNAGISFVGMILDLIVVQSDPP